MNRASNRELQLPAFTPIEGESTLPDVVRYLRTLNRYKWGILMVVIAVGMLAAMYASSLRPVYRSTATVMVEMGKPRVVSNAELYESFVGSTRDYFLTQYEIIKSRALAERLVRVMQLTKHPEYAPGQRAKPWYAEWVPALFLPAVAPGAPAKAPNEEDLVEGVASQVMGGIQVQPVRNTQLVKLSFESHDPVLAERVPNTLAMIYIVSDLEERGDTTRRSMSFLRDQAVELKQKLNESERALQEFRERERIVVEKGVAVSGTMRQLEEIDTALQDARRKRLDAEARYNQVNTARLGRTDAALDSLPVVQSNPVVARFKEAEAEAERRVSEASKRYGPEHPRMVSAQSDLKAVRDNIRQQVRTVVDGVLKDYEVTKANEASLERALARAKMESQEYNRKEFTLARLEREVASNRQLYDLFTQRAKETNTGDVPSAIARVIDVAKLPKSPSGTNKSRIVGIAMLVALAVAVAIALLLEQLDTRVKTSHEVEAKLEVKAIGVLPRMRPRPGVPIERIFVDENRSAFAEGIRSIRSDLMLSGIDSPQKVVLVTSSVPEEGKTTVACNLAFAFSQVKKTLLVEADMRRPKIARVLDANSHRAGLSELVAGNAPLDECVYPADNSNLWVLQSGRVPLNPLELLSSQRFTEVMQTLKQAFDVIIIDSPPLQMVSDALVLSQFATSVLYVVKADSTPYPLARHGLMQMKRVNEPALVGLGAVLNQLDVDKANKYYGEYRGYGGRYYRPYGYDSDPAGSGKPTTAAAVEKNVT
ncbi:MAG: polysaccharide biosynthesis tyrosine autokinase [Burkholderiales bacterium]|nr:polysaccharide biosynthesis tyrosine autokinase [Burkholderiales bacterium]